VAKTFQAFKIRLSDNSNKGIRIYYCTPAQLQFPGFKRRKVQADFSGGHVSSDAGDVFCYVRWIGIWVSLNK